MVNVLSSRGKSKEFLRLEIYKRIIQSISLYILFAFGLNAFLYSLVASSFLGTSLNIWFATREIGLKFFSIGKLLLTQMAITIAIVLVVEYLFKDIMLHSSLDSILMILVKGSVFLLLFILINLIFKTESFIYVKEQFKSALIVLRNKKNEQTI